MAFAGNPLIFEAQIDTVDPAIKVLQPGMAVPFLVYLPIHVTVTAAYQGDVTAGQSVVLRDLGGAAGCTTFTTDVGYPDGAWQPGVRLFVFANDVTSPEGKAALTPNWVFAERKGLAVSLRGDGTKTMSVTEVRNGVRQRWPAT